MPRERPAAYEVRAPKRTPVAERGLDRVLFDSLLATVDRKMADNRKNLGAPKDAEAHRRRVEEAVDLALNSKNLAGERRRLFLSRLLAEVGKRGGEQASAKRTADEELDHAFRQAYMERQLKLHAAQFGPDNGLDDTEQEQEAKE